MFLHVGKDAVIPYKDIIAFIDLTRASKSEKTSEFLDLAKVEKRLDQNVDRNKAKSCVITPKRVYLSKISTATLVKRVSSFKGS